VPLSFRVTADVRMALEEAALRNGRSLSHEAEFRLEASFVDAAATEKLDTALDALVKLAEHVNKEGQENIARRALLNRREEAVSKREAEIAERPSIVLSSSSSTVPRGGTTPRRRGE
jgi:CO/xanthine dehydrogenase Mo-binding subunit